MNSTCVSQTLHDNTSNPKIKLFNEMIININSGLNFYNFEIQSSFKNLLNSINHWLLYIQYNNKNSLC